MLANFKTNLGNIIHTKVFENTTILKSFIAGKLTHCEGMAL